MHKSLLTGRLGRWLAAAAFGLLAAPAAQAQLAGTKAIPGDYATVAAAITALNAQGVGAGGVTFNIAAGYTETFASPTAGAITATGTSANPVVFQKSGTGANPKITAGVGTSTSVDAIISLAGSDYVTFDGLDVAENSANTTATTQMESGYALFRPSATDGCQNNIIRNCVVTLNKTNAGTIGISGAPGTAASTTAVAATATSGANSNNKVYGNVVTNALIGIYFNASSTTTTANLDQNNEIGVTAGNTVGNFGGSASAYGVGGAYQNGLKVSGNTINSTLNYTSASASTAVAASTITSTLRGVYVPNGSSTTSLDITNNTITLASGATSSQMSGIETSNSATTVNITGNTVTGCTYASSTSGAFYGIYSSGTPTTLNLLNNTVSNNTVPGTGSFYMLNAGSPATTLNITGNQLTGNTKGGVSTTVTSGSMYGINVGTATITATNNTVTNNAATSAGSTTSSTNIYGYYSLSSAPAETITGNTITGLSVTGTTTSSSSVVAGFYHNTVTTATRTLSQNTVGSLSVSTAGSGTAYGFYSSSGGNVAISRNKVYDLSAGGTSGLAYGLYLISGAPVTASNNLLGDLKAPASTSAIAVSGIYVGAATNVNLYFNTVYVNAASTSTTTFGTSGIYVSSTTPAVDLRNNIVVNTSTSGATGGAAAALRYVSAPTSAMLTAANNNLYYAGTPSATNLIYVEGSTTLANPQQTLAAYKAYIGGLSGGTGRELASVTENPPFLSTTGTSPSFLHINPAVATQVESAAQPISGITTDFDGDTRNTSTPDIGADEGTFTPLDLTGPSITFTALGNTSSTANRTLTATITDPSGVATGANAPRLYYRKGTSGAFVFVNATSVSGSSYTFTFDYAAVGGVTSSDVIQYYVAAQDVPGNAATSPFGGSYTTNPGTVNQFAILSALNGTYYVGTSTSPDPTRTYATLTAAASAYSSSGMSGPVTFLLLDNAYSAATGETFPVIFFNNIDASATNTLLIKPNTGATPVITSATNVLALASTRYVTIDGSNTAGGTTRNLTLTTASTAASAYALGLLSQTGQAQSNQFAMVRNVNIIGGGVTANATLGIVLSGPDNDNVTLQNNSIVGVTTGIQAFGTTNTSTGGLDGLVITGNVVGPGTAATGQNINEYGIVVASAISPVVSRNEVQNIVNPTATFASNMTGIVLQDVKTGIVSRNSVHNLVYNGTSTAKLYGISTQLSTSGFNTAANPTATRFDNNLVYALNSSAVSASWNTSGINNNGGYGDQYYYNTVYLTGALSAATGTAGSAAFSNGNGISSTAATNIDVRNNIFSIIGGTGGTATTPLYAHYTTLASYTGSTLNYNDLYVTVGATGAARIGRLNSVDANTLADWRTATGQEANSVSVDPSFAQTSTVPYDLTPSVAALNGAATPITSVTFDYLGTVRGSSPDIGAYEFTPSPVDITPTALASPTTTGCYGTSETVSVTITNNATAPLNYALNPTTVTVVVTLPGGTTQTFTTTVSTGTLAPNATQTVTLPGTLNMSAAGSYSFAITTTTTGDGNSANDNLTATRTVVAPLPLPYSENFNASTTLPAGYTVDTGNSTYDFKVLANHGTAGSNALSADVYGTNPTSFAILPKLGLTTTANNQLMFDARFVDFSSYPATATTLAAGDTLNVLVSTNCGVSFSKVFAINASNYNGTGTASTSFYTYLVPLTGVAAGQTVQLQFFAKRGNGDYYVDIDNINVRSLSPIDVAPVALLTPSAAQTCLSNAETVSVSISNQGSQALNFATNPATVTAVVTTPGGPQTLTATVSTGTLAPNATQTVTLAPTLDMTALGAYSFAISATVTGDQNTANDVLTPAPAITVVAPTAGTLTASASALCVSGTTALALTGSLHGSIQLQQSTDNVTFTDVAGATGTSYTTPVLNQTTYYRARVSCNANTATSNVVTITVTNPLVATTNTPLTICSGSTATLTATASTGATVRFFSTATGGTALTSTTPGSYTTPALTATTTYYAEAVVGSQENVGAAAYNSSAQTQQTGGALYFTATGPTTISNVTVYLNAGQTAGTVTIDLRSGSSTSGAIVNSQSTAFAVPAGPATGVAPYVIPLNYTVPAAGQYTLYLSSATQGGLLRDNAGANTTSYPYTSPSGTVSITGASVSGYYYYFYNWQIGSSCASATRTPIQVNVTAPATASFPNATAATCGTSAFQLAGTIGGSATSGTYTSSGTGTFSPNATTLGATYTPSAADVTAGTVTITLTTNTPGSCAAGTAAQTLTISPAPVATFSYPAATTYCAGSTSTVTPTLGTGATAGTFSSTTGLSIDATTGVITLSTSTAGTYTVTNTVAASGACAAVSATTTVTITPAASAAFTYANASFCQSGTNPSPTVTGSAGGTFSSTTGLSLNATTGAINLSASTLGTYTVTYTVAGACGTSATATVSITAAQAATFSYATATGCVGSTSTVTPTLATGSSAGTFSSTTGLSINATTGAINLAASTAGTYTVTNTVAASGGCAAATATATFTVNPRPATPTISVAYNGTTTTLTSSATTGNQWYLGSGPVPGATNQTLVLTGLPAQLGSYTVTTTNANGCVSLPSAPLVVTSARNGIAGASLRLYPNPTPNGQMTLELTGYRLATQLTVLDALGRVITSELLPANPGTATHPLNLTGVATGVYLLRLSNADGVETRRLVRE